MLEFSTHNHYSFLPFLSCFPSCFGERHFLLTFARSILKCALHRLVRLRNYTPRSFILWPLHFRILVPLSQSMFCSCFLVTIRTLKSKKTHALALKMKAVEPSGGTQVPSAGPSPVQGDHIARSVACCSSFLGNPYKLPVKEMQRKKAKPASFPQFLILLRC